MSDWSVLVAGIAVAAGLLALAWALLRRSADAADAARAAVASHAQASATAQDTVFRRLDALRDDLDAHVRTTEAHLAVLYHHTPSAHPDRG